MKYLSIQIKRVWRVFPVILRTTLIMAGALGLFAYLQIVSDSGREEDQKITLALVGDTEDAYLGLGIDLLRAMDSSRFTCTLIEMTEEEAERALERQEINGCLIIPDDFIESVVYGENKKVTFVTGTAQSDIGVLLSRELADCVSILLTETQSGIYAFQRFARQQEPDRNLRQEIYDINMRYFQYVLPRAELYDIDTADSTPVISMQGYYVCAALLLFSLFLGMAGGKLFIRGDLSLNRMLAVRGTGAAQQVLSEYVSCCFLLLLNYLAAAAIFALFFREAGRMIPELENISMARGVRLVSGLALLIPVAGALLYFLSQCVRSLISGTILALLCAIGLGYISGCFYPISFFPEGIQRLAAILPTGILMEYMQRALLGEPGGRLILISCVWTFLLVFFSYLIRRYRLVERTDRQIKSYGM